MSIQYLAHTNSSGERQSVREHAFGTAKLCETFAAAFSCGSYGKIMGTYHDLGKYSHEFQNRLLRNGPKVDHASAGALECAKNNLLEAAMCIAGHHGGLQDKGTKGLLEGPSFMARLGRCKRDGLPNIDPCWRDELGGIKLSDSNCSFPVTSSILSRSFWCHFLYSCLVDADFLDTEAFMANRPYIPIKADFSRLSKRLHDYTSPWFPARNELNSKRCEILQACLSKGNSATRGLYTLTVPTGGGKTVASLAFALEHAKARGLERIIYVIPYTSIIEQNAEVFRNILGDDIVLEHHSNVYYDIEDESNPRNIELSRATENWNMPIIVTTAVQFFESLFANRSSKCRKVHNIANSVIIFDEAQMLPLPFLKPCVFAISELVEHYGSTAVLCTATQPALNEIFNEYLPKRHIEELCPDEIYTDKVFKRVSYSNEGQQSWEDIACKMRNRKQALCIVNSRKNAKTLLDELNNGFEDNSQGQGVFHLSTLMCPKHRRKILLEVRKRLKNDDKCHVVSTSLIEAGVDVDFPVVFREISGLDSILQAAGRCNRENKRPAGDSRVTIFEAEERPPLLFSQAIAATRNTLRSLDNLEKLDDKSTIQSFYSELLQLKGDDYLDAHKIIADLKSLNHATIADKFHLIDSQKTVYIPYDDEGYSLIGRYIHGERSRSLLRQLSHYSVSIYDNHFRALEQAGALQLCEDSLDVAILGNSNLYSEQYGLDMQADSGQALFI